MNLHKEYHELDGQTIKLSVWYQKNRGYGVTVLPVKISKSDGFQIEEFGAFTGFNDTLLQVDQQSAKRLKQAIETLHSRKEQYLEAIKSYLK